MLIKKYSLIYSIYNLILDFISFVRDKNTVSKVFYSNDFKLILNTYLNTRFRNDWIGRIYGVINPNININGNIDFSNTIIELNDNLTNDDLFVHNWIYRQLHLMSNALKIKSSAFFDYIGMSIEKIEPSTQNNYLIIFDIVSRNALINSLKHFLKIFILYIIVFFVVIICYQLTPNFITF